MSDIAYRVVTRYLEARSKDLVPARNKETGRLVYVLPETLKQDSSRFERVSPDEIKPEGFEHRPRPPKQPAKPDKPHVPRDPLPMRPRYPKPPQPVKLPKPPRLRKPVKPVPVPEPPRPRKTPVFPGRTRYKD